MAWATLPKPRSPKSEMRHSFSLRTRLVGLMAAMFLCGMIVLYLAARSYGHTAADRSYDQLLAGAALSIAETLSINEGAVQVDVPYAALDMLAAAPSDRVFYRVIAPSGETITGYDDMPKPPFARSRGRSVQEDATKPGYFDAAYRGEQVRFAVLGREVAEPGVRGFVWVQVGQTRIAREALAQELILGALVPIALITVLALVLVWFGVARALLPLQRIGNDLAAREPADLHALPVQVPSEIAPMVDSLNGFMQRLQSNMATLRVFIAEAAHQMRTPLAGLRAQAQLALAEKNPDEVRRGLHSVERNAVKLSRLLNQLLSDATTMHRSDMRQFEPFDLRAVVSKAIRDAVPVSDNVEVTLHSDLETAPYTGDALLISEALKNLIDNALRYGNGEPVAVLLAHDEPERRYALTVSDRGPGIPMEERKTVFERFARGSSSLPGVGLGLAIVKRAVESHRGTVVLADNPGGGLAITLHLPEAVE